MKIPSIDVVFDGIRWALRRFPSVLFCAFVLWLLACILVTHSDTETYQTLWVFVLTAAMGIPLLFGLSVYGERQSNLWSKRGFYVLAGLGVLASYYFSTRFSTPLTSSYRAWQLIFAFHWLVAVLPFLGRQENLGFWQFNRLLLERFVVGAFFAGVLYLGLIVALTAAKLLLGLVYPNELYGYLFFTCTFLFHPLYVLAGVPDQWEELNRSTEYPTPLRLLVQYILIPLVCLYFVILYLYMGKILLAGVWPKGTIGWLVCGISVLGILTMLLAHPLQERAEYQWLKRFTRGLYFAMYPVAILLALALSRRISEYGITQNRYLLLVLLFWLSGIAVRFSLRPATPIKIIPATLAVLALVTSVGPWSAYHVSLVSQRHRLENLLVTNGILQDGKVISAPKEVSRQDRREITLLVDFLVNSYGSRSIQRWFTVPLEEKESKDPGESRLPWGNRYWSSSRVAEKAIRQMGLEPFLNDGFQNSGQFSYGAGPLHGVLALHGADYLTRLEWQGSAPRQEILRLDEGHYILHSKPRGATLSLVSNGMTEFTMDLKPLIRSLQTISSVGGYSLPPSSMTVTAEGPLWRATLQVEYISGRSDPEVKDVDLQHLRGNLLLDSLRK